MKSRKQTTAYGPTENVRIKFPSTISFHESHPGKGFAWVIVGAILIVLSACCFVLDLFFFDERIVFEKGPLVSFLFKFFETQVWLVEHAPLGEYLWFWVPVICGTGGVLMIDRGAKYLAPSAKQLLEKDERQPLLYLRSFKDDEIEIPESSFFGGRYEKKLTKALSAIGPVIAVGKPGEKLPELGAARLYIKRDWQRTVAKLMTQSRLVIIQIGRTEGIIWEAATAIQSLPLSRILFFFPNEYRRPGVVGKILFGLQPDNELRYKLLKESIEHLIIEPLPLEIGKAVFLYFDKSGKARLIQPVLPSLPSSRKTVEINLKKTLDPYLRELMGQYLQ